MGRVGSQAGLGPRGWHPVLTVGWGVSQSGLPCWSAFAEVCLDKARVCARQRGLFSKSCSFPRALFGSKGPRC